MKTILASRIATKILHRYVRERINPSPRDIYPHLINSNDRYHLLSPSVHSFPHTAHTMSSDNAYASFLDKANQDPNSNPTPSTSSTSPSKPQPTPHESLISQSTHIPQSLKSLDVTFTSEADEPFEAFTVSSAGSSLPDAAGFAQAVGLGSSAGQVEELSVEDFDPRGEYGEVVAAVKKAAGNGGGEVKCFRVEGEKKSTVFYYVVGLDGQGGRLVGARAMSVES